MKTAGQPRGRARRTGAKAVAPETEVQGVAAAMAKRLHGSERGKGKGGAAPAGGPGAAAAADRGSANRKRGARVRGTGA